MTEQEFTRKFGRAIRRWRAQLGMDVKDFADFVGVSENTIYNYENRCTMPMLHTAMQIAKKLGVSLDDLLRGE